MKKLLAILIFIVNFFNVSLVNAEEMVQVVDVSPQTFMEGMKKATSLNEMRRIVELDFSDLERQESLDNQELNLKAWTSFFSINGEIKGGIGLYTNEENLIHLILIYPNYSSFDSDEQGQGIINAMLMSTFSQIGISPNEFDVLYKGVIEATPDNNVWCEEAQRYIIANRTDEGIIFIAGGMM